jgi:hypothetical protein
MMPSQEVTSKPGSVSAMAGRSGTNGTRAAVVAPSARSLPSCTSGQTDGIVSNIMSTCPPSSAGNAGPLPV